MYACLIPLLIWGLALPIQIRFANLSSILTSVGQITGITGLVLCSISLILSSRVGALEGLFGGLNKVYTAHHVIGGTAFLLLMVHPVFVAAAFLPVSPRLALAQLLPSANWAVNLGISALLILMGLLIITYFTPVAQRTKRFTHKFLGVVLFIGGLHSLFVPSDISRTPALKFYLVGVCVTGMVLYLYGIVTNWLLVRRRLRMAGQKR